MLVESTAGEWARVTGKMRHTTYVVRGGTQGQDLSSQMLPSSVSTENLMLVPIISLLFPYRNKVSKSQLNVYSVVAACLIIFICCFCFFGFLLLFVLLALWRQPFNGSVIFLPNRSYFRINYLKIINLCLFSSNNESTRKCSPMKHHFVVLIQALSAVVFIKMLQSFL